MNKYENEPKQPALPANYSAAKVALAQCAKIDECKDWADKAKALAVYAKIAEDETLENDAKRIRARAVRRAGQILKEIDRPKQGGRPPKQNGSGAATVSRRRRDEQAGLSKDQQIQAEHVANLSEEQFERQVESPKPPTIEALAKQGVQQRNAAAKRRGDDVSLEQWKKLSTAEQRELLEPRMSNARLNRQETPGIEWAQFSWNPITGCKHACGPVYCYAKEWVERFPGIYPHGFAPTIYPYLLSAPGNTPVPEAATHDARYRNIFVCSLADLFGRWVPTPWIEAVLDRVRENKQWNFLFLTKFPKRISEFSIPPNASMGTTVDCQDRIADAEASFARLKDRGVGGVRWLSCEPMITELKFNRLDLFNWIVIGGCSRTKTAPEWHPPTEWITDLKTAGVSNGRRSSRTAAGIRSTPGPPSRISARVRPMGGLVVFRWGSLSEGGSGRDLPAPEILAGLDAKSLLVYHSVHEIPHPICELW
jgi:protein gp37